MNINNKMQIKKGLLSLIGILFLFNYSNSQTIAAVAPYPNITITTSDFNTLEQTSDDFSGMLKVIGLNTNSNPVWPYVYYSTTDKWPEGTWGRGYNSEYAGFVNGQNVDGQYEFLNNNNEGKYWACHPLMRRVAQFVTGHIHLYLVGHNMSYNQDKIEKGIDYILTQQNTSGNNSGGFCWWAYRQNKTNINMNISENEVEPYETAYALQALSEYILSGLTYRKNEVILAIQMASNYMYNVDWNSTSLNSNVRALGLWSLSDAYKVTNECMAYTKIKQISNILITDQNAIGIWETGTKDADGPNFIWHDTKIEYHMMTLRGLIEAFNVTPSQDEGFKYNLSNTIKNGVNHFINYRISSSSPNVKYAYKYLNGDDVPYWIAPEENQYGSQDILEPIIKLTYYAQNSSFFNSSERTSLRNLSNKLAGGFVFGNWRHFKASCLYADYMDAIDNSTNIFNWTSSDIYYNAPNITDRVVSGDFDNDGFEDDIATFYDYGNQHTTMHIWKSNGSSYSYLWSWDVNGFDANKITGRVVSGDFDGDGYKDDIAAFYDYGNQVTKAVLWRSNGLSFAYSWAWETSGYDANKITGRVVSADFNHDGLDDIAAFYDYGNQVTKINLWKSNGLSFAYSWAWESTGFDANKITGRVVSGDFDYDTFKDDIAAFYDEGNQVTRINLWKGFGSTFFYSSVWETFGYDANKITGRVVSGDFDSDGSKDDIAAFYEYSDQSTKMHLWKLSGPTFDYSWAWENSGFDAGKITGRVVSGDFGQSCKLSDISTFYNYGIDNTRVLTFLDNEYQGSTSWWIPCSTSPYIDRCDDKKNRSNKSISNSEFKNFEILTSLFLVSPNPFTDNIKITQNSDSEISISLTNLNGQLVFNQKTSDLRFTINTESLAKGIYMLKIQSNDKLENFKLVKN